VSRVDLDGRKIDFRLVNESEGMFGRGTLDKSATHEVKLRTSHGDRPEHDAGVRAASTLKADGRKRKANKSTGSARTPEKSKTISKKTVKKRR
jgi:ribonuclease R